MQASTTPQITLLKIVNWLWVVLFAVGVVYRPKNYLMATLVSLPSLSVLLSIYASSSSALPRISFVINSLFAAILAIAAAVKFGQGGGGVIVFFCALTLICVLNAVHMRALGRVRASTSPSHTVLQRTPLKTAVKNVTVRMKEAFYGCLHQAFGKAVQRYPIRSLYYLCLVSFLLSMFLPAVMTFQTGGHGYKVMPGWQILLMGWMAPLALVPQFAWYANPAFLMGVYKSFKGDYPGAREWSASAALTASNTLLWFVWPIPGDEGGVTKIYLSYPLFGFALWYLSMIALYGLNSYLSVQKSKQDVAKSAD
ncbi:MAG: hypothetical protein AABY95_01965 [Pseudomonadota bacterium]